MSHVKLNLKRYVFYNVSKTREMETNFTAVLSNIRLLIIIGLYYRALEIILKLNVIYDLA